jgi:hypothetical protein
LATTTVARTVADHVDGGPRHVHELVDAEDQRDPLERKPVAGQRTGEITSEARGTPATPLEVSMSVSSMVTC